MLGSESANGANATGDPDPIQSSSHAISLNVWSAALGTYRCADPYNLAPAFMHR
jgi:hypothetical protein